MVNYIMVYMTAVFTANDGKKDELTKMLAGAADGVRKQEDCLSAKLLVNAEENEVILFEEWTSQEAHKEWVDNMPKEALSAFDSVMDGQPSFNYFNKV